MKHISLVKYFFVLSCSFFWSGLLVGQQDLYSELKMVDELISNDRKGSEIRIIQIRSQAREDGDEKLIAETYVTQGNLFYSFEEFDEAIEEYEMALQMFERRQDTVGLEKVLNHLGATYTVKGDYLNSLEYYLKGYSYTKNSEESEELVGNHERIENYLYILNNLGTTYYEMQDFKLARDYFEKVVYGATQINDDISLGKALMDLSNTYVALNNYDEAKKLLLQSIRVEKASDGVKNTVALKYALLSRLHLKLNEKYEAKYHLENAVKFYEDGQLVRWDQAKLLSVMSELYLGFNQFDKALAQSKKAYLIAAEFSLKEIEVNACAVIAKSYAGLKNYEKAYEFELKLKKLQVSNVSNVSSLEVARIEMKLNYEKKALLDSIEALGIQHEKERELFEVNDEIRKRKWVIVFMSIGLFLLLITIMLLIFFSKKKASNNLLLKKSLGEKEVLLKEVHHRVKNNFQVISSLLNLQLGTKMENVEDALKVAQNRIQSMALVHRKLYGSTDFEAIEMQSYLTELVDSIVSTNQITESFKVEIVAEGKFLVLDKAIPLGLIFNELITNFFKYVANKKNGAHLLIQVEETDSIINVLLRDNGDGLPEDIDLDHLTSLGLELVSILAEQISAELEIKNDNGTVVNILIPKE
jgi:two-component sensor histidine kinase